MTKKLKGVIFSIGNVFSSTRWNQQTFTETIQLLKFIQSKGLQPVVLANRPQTICGQNVETVITQQVGQFPWFMAIRDNLPKKPRAEAMKHVLKEMGWDATEAVYVGNRDDDMRTALNGRVLFLNALWYGQNTEYGIKVETPLDVGRFIDIFCLRDSFWHYQIKDDSLEYYSLGTFSTYKPDLAVYSEDARGTAKTFGAGHPDFWTKYIWSTIYFSELYKAIDFVAPYPGHKASTVSVASNVIEEPMLAFTKCFRITYLRDLIVRHTKAQKSQSARIQGISLDHNNQLSTIHINSQPLRANGKKVYKNSPIKNKTVLVVDDICTKGYSLEAARIYLESAGARVVCLSWLKTINTDYVKNITPYDSAIDPYVPNMEWSRPESKLIPYRRHITDSGAGSELSAKLAQYQKWKWPEDL